MLEKDCYIRRGRQARNIIALLRSATCCLWYGFVMDAVTKARQIRCYGILTHWRRIILHENSFMRSLLYHAEGLTVLSGIQVGMPYAKTRHTVDHFGQRSACLDL